MKKSITSIVFACLCFYSNLILSQDNSVFNDIVDKLASFNNFNNLEKTYLITDKDFYINGETIWYKVFLLNGSNHLASDKSKVVHIELINNKNDVVTKQKLFNEGTTGVNGNIEIPETIEKGQYKLRAYTKYMLNEKQPIIHSKTITIQFSKPVNTTSNVVEKSNKNEKDNLLDTALARPNITFFPEGGNLVTGISSSLGIKVTDEKGNGIALKGKIFDENDNLITVFKSYEFGLGKTFITPEINKKYFAKITVNDKIETYPLPNPLKTGHVLRIRNLGESLEIDVATSLPKGLNETMLIGHIRGRTFYKHIEKSKDSIFSIKLLTKDLEDGVAHFTLFTQEGEPVCERLVFIDNEENDVVLTAKLNSTIYGQREKVSIELDLKNKKGQPLKANLTTSVVTNTNQAINSNSGIKSWLLLNSDIGGTITNANYFFNKSNPKRKSLLDALMLTHGWRRFVWKDLMNKNVSKDLKFKPEKGIMIEGQVSSFYNKSRTKESLVSINFLEDLFQEEKKTSPQGKFSFGPYTFNDSISVLIQTKPIKKITKTKKLSIHVEDLFTEPQLDEKIIAKTTTIEYNFPEKYFEQAYKNKTEKFKNNPKTIKLKEVIAAAEKKKTRQELIDEEINEIAVFGNVATPNKRIFTDSLKGGKSALSALELLHFVPRVQVIGSFPLQNILIPSLAGRSLIAVPPPLILFDGFTTDLDFINSLRADDILFVDAFLGPEATIFGARGNGGVIAFYSNRKLSSSKGISREFPNIIDFKIDGFSKVREFYSPNYDVPNLKHEQADYRTTLHWEPNSSIIDSEGKNISFFTGDHTGEYSVKIEGVTLDGIPINTIKTFTVN